jgi:NAD(P)-dependent dehydrogenase (short-subunit alcohol dehydrogenase family)
VVLADLQEEAAQEAARELAGEGAEVESAVVDVADPDAMHALARRVLDRFGRLDLVVNNAGVVPSGAKPMWEADLQEWRRTVDVNLFGVLHGVRAFVPHLVAAGRGHVINIASLAGLAGTPLTASYGATKHAVVALSEMLEAELAMKGLSIGVSVVCPGFVRTSMTEGMQDASAMQEWAEQMGTSGSELIGMIEETAKDMLEPDEAARRILEAAESGALHVLPSGDVADGAWNRARRVLDALESE